MKQYINHVLLYTFVNASNIINMLCQPSVSLTLRISKDFSITVWLNDTKLEKSELKWLFGHNKGKLKHWSQLNNLIARYAIDIVEPENTSICQTIAYSTLVNLLIMFLVVIFCLNKNYYYVVNLMHKDTVLI